MARKYHPDVSPPDAAAENTRRFIEVQEAYETLSDPSRRATYDRALARGVCRLAFSASRRVAPYYQPVWDTVKRDLARIVSNLKVVIFPNPYREDPGKELRDWDLWGPFFFIVFLGLTLSWSASVKKIRAETMDELGEPLLGLQIISSLNRAKVQFLSDDSPD
ncbi:hypothetical protein E2562_038181 [Oryza meyeriana var. granulata]|uniref:J domain-containing protein n=1 Tax=Oryza meyeriana var. granulata TaxID=110450 RepID=A0A6G1CM77_9ORYZ|nr:hypothetical protein E2562_038181 [Oryza meyeriana var. granulata]